jgi:Fe-S cluster assembly iron-binding protein IscA
MIQVTESAANELRSVLASSQAPQDRGLKLVPNEKGEVALTIDKPQLGDDVVKEGDRPLLIVDSTLVHRLDGAVFDIVTDGKAADQPSRFLLRDRESG